MQCPEASRFGDLIVSPSNLQPGDWFTVHTDFTCAVSAEFDIVPKFLDYYIEVPGQLNNGHEQPILLARRKFHHNRNTPPIDTFNVQLPFAFYFAGAAYEVNLAITYPVNGSNGKPVFIQGGSQFPVNITVPSS